MTKKVGKALNKTILNKTIQGSKESYSLLLTPLYCYLFRYVYFFGTFFVENPRGVS